MTKKVSKKKKVGIIYKLFSILLLLVTFVFIGAMIYLNILSLGFLILLIVVLLGVVLFLVMLMLKSRKKRLGLLISFIMMLFLGLLSFYVLKTTDFLSDLNLDYKTYNYSVVVLKNSDYRKLKDISNKNMGYYDNASDEGEKALSKIQSKIEVEPTSYDDTQKISDDLLDEKIDAALLEDSYLDILNENASEDGTVFEDKIRTIYKFKVVVKTNDISKDANVTKEPFSIYISGIDTFGEISSVSRSDVNMVVTVNPKTKQILLTSIPRDYYVSLHGKSGLNDKLTHAGLYGIDMSIQTIEDLLDIEINYYVKVNFTSVIDVVNAIGGVNVYSDYDFTSIDKFHYSKGLNAVNGEEALSFARERKAFATGDRQRVKNQQALLKGIFEKCTSKAIITKYTKLLDSMNGKFVTNMKMSRLTSLIKMQLSKNYSWNLVTNSLEGSDAKNYTYSAPSSLAYVMEPIDESVEYASELIDRVIKGEILDSEEVASESSKVNSVTRDGSSSSSSSSSSSTNDNTGSSSSSNYSGLEIKLGKSKVSFEEGETYVYYAYQATYNGKDVTDSSGISETFKINGKEITDWHELILYVSNLSSGTYTIVFHIEYQGDSVNQTQTVVISPSSQESGSFDDGDLDDYGNDDTKNENDSMEENNGYLE